MTDGKKNPSFPAVPFENAVRTAVPPENISSTEVEPFAPAADAMMVIDPAEQARNLRGNSRKLAVLLGMLKKAEARRPPDGWRIFTLTLPRREADLARTCLQDAVLECGESFIGDQNDEYAAMTLATASAANITHVLKKLEQAGIANAQIAVAQDGAVLMRVKGAPVIALHGFLNNNPLPELNSGRRVVSLVRDRPPVDITAASSAGECVPFDFASVSASAVKKAVEEKFEIPREGSCSFLAIDQNIFAGIVDPNDGKIQRFIEEMKIYANSTHMHIVSCGGYVVIIGTSERAASSLALLASRLRTLDNRAKFFLGAGEICREMGGRFSIKGFFKIESRGDADRMRQAGIYFTEEFFERVAKAGSRDASLCQVFAKPSLENKNFLKAVVIRPKVTLHVGGPDRLIGYEQELDKLKKSLRDSRTKLMMIKGKAGYGKSRLLHEALKEYPSSLICSMDSSGENVPGFSLITVAEQVAAAVSDNRDVSRTAQFEMLNNFNREPLNNCIAEAQSNPDRICGMILNVLRQANRGRMIFGIDDFHNVDRFSVPYLTGLMQEYASKTSGACVIAGREEEYMPTDAIDGLKKNLLAVKGFKSEEVRVAGLNFADDEIARRFVFYSLPEKLRGSEENPVNLGDWYKVLAGIAGDSPYVMKTLLDGVMEDAEKNINEVFETRENTLLLKEGVLERLCRIKNSGDLAVYYMERIGRMPEDSRRLLQHIAYMSGDATYEQARVIAMNLLGAGSEDQFAKAMEFLINRGYLIGIAGPGQKLKIQHETMRDTLKASVVDPEIVSNIVIGLFNKLAGDPELHPFMRAALANNVARCSRAPALDHPFFWEHYARIMRDCFRECAEKNARGAGCDLAGAVVNAADAAKMPEGMMQVLNRLRQGGVRAADDLQKLVVEALFVFAENAVYTAKFTEARRAVDLLAELNAANPELTDENNGRLIDMAKAYYLMFFEAYVQGDYNRMAAIYERKLEGGRLLEPGLRVICEMKLKFRETNLPERDKARIYDEIDGIYKKGAAALKDLDNEYVKAHPPRADGRGRPGYQKHHPHYLEALRLWGVRIKTEKVLASMCRRRLNGREYMVDEDCLRHPAACDLNQIRVWLLEIDESLGMFEQLLQHSPQAMHPYAELSVREQRAELLAVLGKHEEADAAYGEARRQANQLGLPAAAARITHCRAGLCAIQARCRVEVMPSAGNIAVVVPNKVLNRDELKKGIRILDTDGAIALANITDQDNYFYLAIPIQKMHLAGMLCESYSAELDVLERRPNEQRAMEIYQELKPYLQMAVENYKCIEKYLEKQIKNGSIKKGAKEGESGYFLYYLVSYVGFVFKAIDIIGGICPEVGIRIPSSVFEIENPVASLESRLLVRNFMTDAESGADKLTDCGTGELDAKRKGFDIFNRIIVKGRVEVVEAQETAEEAAKDSYYASYGMVDLSEE